MQKYEYHYKKFNEFINNQNFNFEPHELYDPIAYTLALGGNKVFASIDRNHTPRKNILGFSLKFGE